MGRSARDVQGGVPMQHPHPTFCGVGLARPILSQPMLLREAATSMDVENKRTSNQPHELKIQGLIISFLDCASNHRQQ